MTCVTTGAVAMLSRKGRGRHSNFGTIYFWGLVAVFASATALAAARWAEDYPLFILAALCAYCGLATASIRFALLERAAHLAARND